MSESEVISAEGTDSSGPSPTHQFRRIGIVCPYSWDAPGGVQTHVRDLAHALIAKGYEVSVLAPGDDEPDEDFVVSAGRAIPIRYNGSVARLIFGPLSTQRVRRWIDEGHFDILHVHEPAAPSLSLVATWAAEGAIVGTFHTSNENSRMMSGTARILRSALEKLNGRISVSEYARETLREHIGFDSVIVPNGVDVAFYADAEPMTSTPVDAEVVTFLGRVDEPRKGFQVFAQAMPAIARERPEAVFYVAGPGDVDSALKLVPRSLHGRIHFMGRISDGQKAALLRRSNVFVAPNTGGESFGIILLEAMAAGACVVASDLEAFVKVLGDDGAGRLFPNEDFEALAREVIELLTDKAVRERIAHHGRDRAYSYDWNAVVNEVIEIYDTVYVPGEVVREDVGATALGRAKLWGRGESS
ncbi:MAG: glycosyltransferase family 4 protein [Actinomycetes bacterium]